MPTLAITGSIVGEATVGQLKAATNHLTKNVIADCGHLIPLGQPGALADAIRNLAK